jgi:hypothetical protein
MSLINDALKKAQKQRTGDSPPLASMPSIGGDPAAKIANRSAPAGINTLLLRGGVIVAALVVVLLGGYFGLRQRPGATPEPAIAPTVVTAAKEAPKPAAPAEHVPVTKQAAPAITFNLAIPAESVPVTPAEAPKSVQTSAAPETKAATPLATAPSKPASPEVAPVSAPAAAPAIVAATGTPKIEARAIPFIEGLRIAGIRASATDSKVLMNDRVYRSGDIVEHEIGLKLVGITANSLTFEDERGGRYTRNF